MPDALFYYNALVPWRRRLSAGYVADAPLDVRFLRGRPYLKDCDSVTIKDSGASRLCGKWRSNAVAL